MTPAAHHLVTEWLAALEARHLADLRVAEVTRALRALSSAYVERRHKVTTGRTLDTTGKRAAFALFYGPLHFLTIGRIVESLDAAARPLSTILDLGCGTGVAGAAWALAGNGAAVAGIDRHPWAIDEARWTYRLLGLRGQARLADVTRLPRMPTASGIVAAYTLNELPAEARSALEERLLAAAAHGASILIVEPIARGVTPWWDATAARFAEAGGRVDEWRFRAELPPFQRLLDKAAGLRHEELTARTVFVPNLR